MNTIKLNQILTIYVAYTGFINSIKKSSEFYLFHCPDTEIKVGDQITDLYGDTFVVNSISPIRVGKYTITVEYL